MGNAILQSLPQLVDGLLLFESFESASFVTDQAWTVAKGTPLRSNSVAKQGDFSFELDTTECLLTKTFTGFPMQSSGVWFYDDATATAAGASPPFIYWLSNLGVIYGLGVDIATTSTKYCYRDNNGIPVDSGVTRTTGWHYFKFKLVSNFVVLYIDNVQVSSSGIALGGTMTQVKVGCPYTVTPSYQFGFFDVVQVFTGYNLQISNLVSGQVVKLFDSGNSLLFTVTSSGLTVLMDLSTLNYPVNGYITMTKADGVTPYYTSPTQIYSQGDVWVFQVYDFGRRPSDMLPVPNAMRVDTVATAGRQQSLLFYDRDMVVMTVNDLTEAKKNEFLKFWETIKAGKIFGCAVDSAKTFRGRLSSGTQEKGGFTKAFTMVDNTGLQVGDDVQIRDQAGINTMVGKIAIMNSTVLGSFTDYFVSPYVAGDEIRSLYFWPFAITADLQPNVSLTNLRLKRWSITLRFKEAI